MYSCVASFSTQDDGSINAKYVIGTGEDNDGAVVNFTPIIESYKYIDAINAKTISETPLTKDDLSKSPTCIMLDRIYKHLKESGQIIV